MYHEIREITILRSLAVLILMLTHLHDYVDLWWLWEIYPVCAAICLSLFVFISGYCLHLGKKISSLKRLFVFFKQKLVRIYILYIPSLVLFLILFKHQCENKIFVFIEHLFGLQLFLANYIYPYFTIWFIGLIIPYYCFYGISNYFTNSSKSSIKNTSSVLSAFFVVLGVLYVWINFDQRLVLYFPAFIIGVFLSEKGYFSHKPLQLQKYLYVTIFPLVLLLLFYGCKSFAFLDFFYPILKVAVMVSFICMIPLSFAIAIHFIVLRKDIVSNNIQHLSYSSYAIFLFHRPILNGVKIVLSYFQIENTYVLLVLYPMFIFPFIVLPISYIIQKSADEAIKCIVNRRFHQIAKSYDR